MPDNSQITDRELRQIADEIETADVRGDASHSSLLQDMYLDRVYRKRQLTAEALVNECCHYLGNPDVARQHPSLMDASDGDLNVASKYVIWLMVSMAADGIDRGLQFCAHEAEMAFASMTQLNGEQRFSR